MRRSFWIAGAAVLLSLVHLPTLGTRFDFIDDGDLVYPSGPMSVSERFEHLKRRIVANYEHLGPFRPTLHAVWEFEAEAFGADAPTWRIARLVWFAFAAAMMLWLLTEFKLHPVAAFVAAALTMWNPYRNEIWTSLTLSEGTAMPFALFALVCAIRAPRGRRPWVWDIAGFLSILFALGCKNTFAAVVPAMCLLRILTPDGVPGLRRRLVPAALLASALLLPVGHYLWFKLHWHEGQYAEARFSLSFLAQFLRALLGAIGIEFLAPSLVLAGILLHRRSRDDSEEQPESHHRTFLTAAVLLVLGVGLYLPIGAISGRYTMPAVWGLDLLFGVVVHEVLRSHADTLRRSVLTAAVLGLCAMLCANVGRQHKFAARADLLWQLVEHVETTASKGASIGWRVGPKLNAEEGIHFAWHLAGRGRGDLRVVLLGEDGSPLHRRELGPTSAPPDWIVSAGETPGETWVRRGDWTSTYWAGKRSWSCALWGRAGLDNVSVRAENDLKPK